MECSRDEIHSFSVLLCAVTTVRVKSKAKFLILDTAINVFRTAKGNPSFVQVKKTLVPLDVQVNTL
jgi:hypothetical protein